MAVAVFSSVWRPCASRLTTCSSGLLNVIQSNSVRSAAAVPRSGRTAIDIPSPPKRPMNGFLAFSQKKRPELIAKYPGTKYSEIMNKLSCEWIALDTTIRKQYEVQSAEQHSEFKQLRKKWWQNLSVKQRETFVRVKEVEKNRKDNRRLKKKLRDLGMPRKPLTAFNIFMRTTIQQNKGTVPSKEIFRVTALSWKTLTDAEKEKFVELEMNDLERHAIAQMEWEETMRRQGHEDILKLIRSKRVPPSFPKKKEETAEYSVSVKPLSKGRKKAMAPEEWNV